MGFVLIFFTIAIGAQHFKVNYNVHRQQIVTKELDLFLSGAL